MTKQDAETMAKTLLNEGVESKIIPVEEYIENSLFPKGNHTGFLVQETEARHGYPVPYTWYYSLAL